MQLLQSVGWFNPFIWIFAKEYKMQQEMASNAGMVMHEALARVLYSGRASRYFISPGYAYRYIYGVQREAYKKFVAKRA